LLLELPYNEKILLQKIAAGDETAFTSLFNHWHQQLGDYVYRLTGSLSIAEEIVQEVFVTIWTKRELLHKVDHTGSYIYRLCRNKTLNQLRNTARERVRNAAWIRLSAQSSEQPDQEIFFRLIEEAISKLPPQQQKAWILSRHEGLMYEEVATQMKLSRETVKRHIQLSVRFISNYVKQHAELHTSTLLLYTLL
jgi:RNA polymerase sigma-70 factor (ECF subfamily)